MLCDKVHFVILVGADVSGRHSIVRLQIQNTYSIDFMNTLVELTPTFAL